ncbi:MAG: DNA/RNA non-specific endonuclease [Fimbriiglobus sp.]
MKTVSPVAALASDTEVMTELRDLLRSRKKFPREGDVKRSELTAAANRFQEGAMSKVPDEANSEAIVLATGRPSLLVRGGQFEEPDLQTWRERLSPHRDILTKSTHAVGRVEVSNHPDFAWLGTGWMVSERVLVTNRHVAMEFAARSGGGFAFLRNFHGATMNPRIDFREEFGSTETREIAIAEVRFIADNRAEAPDIAIMVLKEDIDFPHLQLGRAARRQQMVAVVGYPARDSLRNPGPAMEEIFRGVYDVKRLAPGFITETSQGFVIQHDCTTLGGNSGSPVLDVESGEVVGLHFSGRFGRGNFAVDADTVRSALRGIVGSTGRVVDAGTERRVTVEQLADREGYDDAFLGSEAVVPLPQLSATHQQDVVMVRQRGRGQERFVLDYMHFSVVMCKSRKGAFFTAVNINGAREVSGIRRVSWIPDPRIPAEFQISGNIYDQRITMDHGHLVRRLDPVWGSPADAKKAHDDTFFLTNSLPQRHAFNAGNWLALEDYLLINGANAEDTKLTVFTGPIYRDSDPEIRGVQVPLEFWKVAAAVDEQGNLRAAGYLLSQSTFLEDLEFVPGRFRTYQLPITTIEERAGLRFGTTTDADVFRRTEGAPGGGVVHLRSPADIRLV